MTRAEQNFDVVGLAGRIPLAETRRWRLAGYCVMALSCLFSGALYWHAARIIASWL